MKILFPDGGDGEKDGYLSGAVTIRIGTEPSLSAEALILKKE